MRATEGTEDELQRAGVSAGAGSFVCVSCSLPLSLDHSEELPECPGCGGSEFKRASMFEQPTLQQAAFSVHAAEPEGWLQDVRDGIEAPGRYLAAHIAGAARVFELGEGWSRIGRSPACDIRIDDPTVSRRHAVVVRTPDGELSALDDRSTNGIAVNGENVDWAPLADGDELQVGRYRLHVIETAGRPAED